MSTQFSRLLKKHAMSDHPVLLDDTRDEIRAHLSMVTSEDDDEQVHADRVQVWEETRTGGDLLVCGSIDDDPVADYLGDEFDPEDEARANPLSVPSQHDEHTTDLGVVDDEGGGAQ